MASQGELYIEIFIKEATSYKLESYEHNINETYFYITCSLKRIG